MIEPKVLTLQDIPLNLAGSIFLAGVALGVILTAAFFFLRSGGGVGGGGEETSHEIIMAIKKRAAGRGERVTFFGAVGMIFFIIAFAVVLLAIVALGKYFVEGKPNGEEFIPYFLRIFVFPLQERFPFLQNFTG